MATRVAITGASGVLGMALALEARHRGHEVFALYHSTPIALPGVESRSIDLLDEKQATEVLEEIQPTHLVHAAAEVRVDWCEDHPEDATRSNVESSVTVARFAARNKLRFVQVSTDSVFDGTRGDYSETDPTGPVNVYSRTKMQAEIEVQSVLPEALLVRTNFIGWNGRHKTGLVDWIRQQFEAQRSLPGFTDAIFCPMLVNDVAVAMLDLLAYDVAGIFHLVGGEAISKYEFAVRIGKAFGYGSALVRPSLVSDVAMRAPRPLNTSLDTSKIAALLGRKMPDVETCLRHYSELSAAGYQQTLNSYFAAR